MRGLFTTVLTLSLLGLVALSPAAAGEKKIPGKIVLDQWDAVYLQGGRAGHVHTRAEEFDRDGVTLIRTMVELRLKVKRFSDTIELGMDVGDVATPEGKVLGTFMRQNLGKGKKLEITGVVDGEQLRLTLDGTQALKPAPWSDGVVGLLKQQTLVKDRMLLKAGDRYDFPGFESSVNLVLKHHIEVKGSEYIELPASKQKLKLLRVESRPEQLEKVQLPLMVTWLDKDGEPVLSETDIPGLGKIRLVRTTKSGALASGPLAQLTDIGLSQLVRLKQRISEPYDTKAAVYRVTIREDKEPASAFSRDGRQQVKNAHGDTFDLNVRATAAATAGKEEKKPGAEYSQSSYFINSADKRVRELTALAIGNASDPWTKALRIERWVHEHMQATNDQALATADHVARTLQGDCTEYAMLTAAMCRATGIPSRTAVGLIYADVRGQPAFAFHMWTEAWADGAWRPLDATLGKGHIGATHLKIVDQSWHDARDMTPLFPVVRVLGRLRIEVMSVQ